jgi:hypothetical protein
MVLRGAILCAATVRPGGRSFLGAKSPRRSLTRASVQHHELLPPKGRARGGDLTHRCGGGASRGTEAERERVHSLPGLEPHGSLTVLAASLDWLRVVR